MEKIRINAMKTEKIGERVCPIEENVKIFGGKWKASILYLIRLY